MERFPYTNFHDLNLDWIIQECKSLGIRVDEVEQALKDYKPDEEIINLVYQIAYGTFRDGTPVPEDSPYYHNNCAWFVEQATAEAQGAAQAAQQAGQDVQTAQQAATDAQAQANRAQTILDSIPESYEDLEEEVNNIKRSLNGLIEYASSEGSSDKTITGASGNNVFRYIYLDANRVALYDYAKIRLINNTGYNLMMVFTFYDSNNIALGNTGWKYIQDDEDLYNRYIKSLMPTQTVTIMISYAFSTTTNISDRITGIDNLNNYSFAIYNMNLVDRETIEEDVSSQMGWLEDVVGIQNITIDQLYDSSNNVLPKTAKFILGILPEKANVDSLEIVVQGNSTEIIKLEKWEYSDTSNGYVYAETVVAESISPYSNISGKYLLHFRGFIADKKTILTFSDVSSLGWVNYKNLTDGAFQKFDSSLTVVTPSDIITQTGANILYYLKYKSGSTSPSSAFVIVDSNGNGDFTTVTEAVLSVPEGTPILIMPGVYDGTVQAFQKRIILMGVDRNRCIIRSTDGRYDYPAINGSCGYIANLTIYSQYVSGTSQEIDGLTSGAYAFHCENEYGKGDVLEFHNCLLKSDFFPALGAGLRKDFQLILDDCELINNQEDGRGTYTSDGSLGALYFHDSNGEQGTQRVSVKNCLLKSSLGNTMTMYQVAREPQNNTVYCEFIGNVLHDAINGYLNNIWYRGDPLNPNTGIFEITIGYGNSNSGLNN